MTVLSGRLGRSILSIMTLLTVLSEFPTLPHLPQCLGGIVGHLVVHEMLAAQTLDAVRDMYLLGIVPPAALIDELVVRQRLADEVKHLLPHLRIGDKDVGCLAVEVL